MSFSLGHAAVRQEFQSSAFKVLVDLAAVSMSMAPLLLLVVPDGQALKNVPIQLAKVFPALFSP